MNTLPKHLFHVHSTKFPTGSLIRPGRYGDRVLKGGKDDLFFFREHLLEIWRREKTAVKVSRFSCSFAFESEAVASQYASDHEYVHRVLPLNEAADQARLDAVWLTWIGESGSTTDKIALQLAGYWSGKATTELDPKATAAWEWLFSCPLQVL